MQRILFVCNGNSGRSPACEVFARHEAWRQGKDIEVLSAGVGAIDDTEEGGDQIGVLPDDVGAAPNPHFVKVMDRAGFGLVFRAHQRRMVRLWSPLSVGYNFEVIVAMTQEIAEWLIADGAPEDRVVVANSGYGIPDPAGPEDLDPVARMCLEEARRQVKAM